MMPSNNHGDAGAVLWRYDLSPIAERALAEHPEVAENYHSYEKELRRFFSLILESKDALGMISPRIDALWHSLITFTPLYRDFCDRVFGFYVDHMPRTVRNPIPTKAVWNFFDRYRAAFGDVPDCWFEGLAADVASDLKAGTVPAALLWSGWVPPHEAQSRLKSIIRPVAPASSLILRRRPILG